MRNGLRSLMAIICFGAAPLSLAAQEEEVGKGEEEGGCGAARISRREPVRAVAIPLGVRVEPGSTRMVAIARFAAPATRKTVTRCALEHTMTNCCMRQLCRLRKTVGSMTS